MRRHSDNFHYHHTEVWARKRWKQVSKAYPTSLGQWVSHLLCHQKASSSLHGRNQRISRSLCHFRSKRKTSLHQVTRALSRSDSCWDAYSHSFAPLPRFRENKLSFKTPKFFFSVFPYEAKVWSESYIHLRIWKSKILCRWLWRYSPPRTQLVDALFDFFASLQNTENANLRKLTPATLWARRASTVRLSARRDTAAASWLKSNSVGPSGGRPPSKVEFLQHVTHLSLLLPCALALPLPLPHDAAPTPQRGRTGYCWALVPPSYARGKCKAATSTAWSSKRWPEPSHGMYGLENEFVKSALEVWAV